MGSCLFLSGVGRSGTTAFRRSLGRHSAIYYEGTENNVVQDVLHVARANWMTPSRRRQLKVTPEEYRRAFGDLLCRLLWPDPRHRNRTYLLAAVNLPAGSSADFLCELFPSAKLLCLVRNGIAVVNSRIDHRSFAQDSFEQHCDVWLQSVELYRWAQMHESCARTFRQEWMNQQHQLRSQLEGLFQWLEIPWEQQVLDSFLERRYLAVDSRGILQVSAAEYRGFDDAQRLAFEQSRLDRWQLWTDRQKQTFSDKCGQAMRQLNYEIPWET